MALEQKDTYTLYYYNEAMNVCTIELRTLNNRVRCPENLFFIALRKGISFVLEPHKCVQFTHLERLYIRRQGFTTYDFKNEVSTNFRLQNSYLEISCVIDIDEPVTPPEPITYTIYGSAGYYSCYKKVVKLNDPVYVPVVSKKEGVYLAIGDTLYSDANTTIPVSYTFIKLESQPGYAVLVNGVITEFIPIGSACDDGVIVPDPILYRYLGEVQVTGRAGDVITLQYLDSTGNAHQQTWIANGTGEEVYHAFGVGMCVSETSVGLDAGTLIANIWDDGISCII